MPGSGRVSGEGPSWQAASGPLLLVVISVLAALPLRKPTPLSRATPLARSVPAFPLVFLVGALLLFLIVLGLRRQQLSPGGLGVGAGMFLMVAVFVTLVSILVWRIGTLWMPARFNRWLGSTSPAPASWLFFGGLVALSLAVFTYRYQRALPQEPLPDLVAGVLLNWFLFLLLTNLATPGISYLFFWPLLAALPLLAWNSLGRAETAGALSRPGWVLALLPAVVTLLLWIPFLIRFFLAQGLDGFFLQVGAVVFLAGMLLPVLAPLLRRDRGILAELLFLASLVLGTAGLFMPG